jgi:hypothetical protein
LNSTNPSLWKPYASSTKSESPRLQFFWTPGLSCRADVFCFLLAHE